MTFNLTKVQPDYDPDYSLGLFHDIKYAVYKHRPWFRRQKDKFHLHPIVLAALKLCRPANRVQLVLEWGHASDNDPNKIAFTRDDKYGEADRVLVTSMGKYITRHFPEMPDHYVRDLVEMHTVRPDVFKLLMTLPEMIEAVRQGPRSCMTHENADDDEHPYRVYHPSLGWHMAIRCTHSGSVDGRALCCTHGESKFFVRSYRRPEEERYSDADNALEGWLKGQGYQHRSTLAGSRMLYITNYAGEVAAPYLDGNDKVAYQDGNHLVICSKYDNFEYECNNTNGWADIVSSIRCEDCGERVRDGDDTYNVGISDDITVCSGCFDDYVEAYTRRGWQRFIHSNDTVEVNGDYYDVHYLGDNNIVGLACGDYALVDDCVEIDDEWYLSDDDDIVEIDGEWYLKDDEAVELVNGEYVLRASVEE